MRKSFIFWLAILPCLALYRPAVAQDQAVIEATKRATALVEITREEAFGSAFCIDPSGLFITNAHVVAEARGRAKINVVINSGEADQLVLHGTVLRSDPERDLAIISAPSPQPLPALQLDSTSKLSETQTVAAFGFPFGKMLAADDNYPSVSVVTGRITALRKVQGQLKEIQTDAAVNPGNSGGPLISLDGKVLGVIYAGIEGANSLNFAIPAVTVQEMLDTPLMSFEYPAISPANASREVPFTVTLTGGSPKKLWDVAIQVFAGGLVDRTFPAKLVTPNRYEARVILLPEGTQPTGRTITVQATVSYKGQIVSANSRKISLAGLLSPGGIAAAQPGGGTPGTVAPTIIDPVGIAPPVSTPGGSPPANPAPAGNAPEGDWLGNTPSPAPEFGSVTSGSISTPNRNLVLPGKEVNGTRITPIELGSPQLSRDLFWSPNGDTLYTLEKPGIVHQIRTSNWVETRRLQVDPDAEHMAMTSAGLVIAEPAEQKLLVVDPGSLAIKATIPLPAIGSLAGSPASSLVYVWRSEAIGDSLAVVDMKTGQIANSIDADTLLKPTKLPAPAATGPKLQHLIETPDAHYLFGSVSGRLVRFVIDNFSVRFDETGTVSGNDIQRITISADSNYVAMPSVGGNTAPENPAPESTLLYKVKDLSRPVLSLITGPDPRDISLDRIGGKIYAQSRAEQVQIYSAQGTRLAVYRVTLRRGAFVDRVLASPQGNKVLVLTNLAAFWIELAG